MKSKSTDGEEISPSTQDVTRRNIQLSGGSLLASSVLGSAGAVVEPEPAKAQAGPKPISSSSSVTTSEPVQ